MTTATKTVTLPAWAAFKSGAHRIPVINVNADKMYAAWLVEIAAYYKDIVRGSAKPPAEMADDKDQPQLRKEWVECFKELDPPSAYWLEVAYQCMKLELQVAMRTFTFEIHVHDSAKRWAQKKAKKGRGAEKAAGGVQGGKEAREHFARLRGVLPV